MGYSIEDFVYDSDFIKNIKIFFDAGGYDPEDESKTPQPLFYDLLFTELERLYYIEADKDSDYRFEKYKQAFLGGIFRAITGGENNDYKPSERVKMLYQLLDYCCDDFDSLTVNFKNNNGEGVIVSSGYSFSKEEEE